MVGGISKLSAENSVDLLWECACVVIYSEVADAWTGCERSNFIFLFKQIAEVLNLSAHPSINKDPLKLKKLLIAKQNLVASYDRDDALGKMRLYSQIIKQAVERDEAECELQRCMKALCSYISGIFQFVEGLEITCRNEN
ncbi:hypothetical protein [Chitinophaga japonensis]|uniref:Uncharacterized protein n=1 Tax=Chitinophaga japonensis TaxID=104662 RepID=A0A562T386_CHIJA|nr:hypothetical protein [Chitinophaga japonensis]TWI87788.1 hypothetical protein LX66_1859 [Chitinophaga japonensis]